MSINKMRKSKKWHKKGFTLVELLVAIVIMSILTVSVFAITNSASRTFAKGTDSIKADDVKDLVLALVKKNLYSKDDIVLDSEFNHIGEGGAIDVNIIKDHHAVFSCNGRAYYLPSVLDGVIEYDENGLPAGSVPLLSEDAYDKYGVKLSFMPLVNVSDGSCVALRVQATVYATSEPDKVIARGRQSFTLMNVERLGNNVEYDVDGYTQICYYV